MRNMIRISFVFGLMLVLSTFSSCVSRKGEARYSGVNPAPADLLHIERMSVSEVKKLGQNGINPYIEKKSLVIKRDDLFYVYRLSFLPAESVNIRLVSSFLEDATGTTIVASAEPVEGLRTYWSRYIMPDDDRTALQSIIDRTYFGRVDFTYSSKKGKQYMLVFIGKGSEASMVQASFNFIINNESVQIEVN